MFLKRAALLVVLAGCPEGERPECAMIGASDVMIVASDPLSKISDVVDGGTVPLMAAPQGGHIILVGARVRAPHDCDLTATASLRDPTTQRVIGLEQRPLLLEQAHNGWAKPQQGLAAMPNVAVCPSAVTSAIDGHEFLLEVTVATQDEQPLATLTAMVTLTCSDNFCRSDCGAH